MKFRVDRTVINEDDESKIEIFRKDDLQMWIVQLVQHFKIKFTDVLSKYFFGSIQTCFNLIY